MDEEFQNNQEAPSSESETAATENTESHSTEEAQPESQASQSISEEARIMQTYAQNAMRQNQSLQNEIAELRKSLAPKPPAPKPIDDEDFRDSPARAMERMLEQKINEAISPIAQDFAVTRRERAFANQFQSTIANVNPALVQYSDALAPMVRQVIGDADPTPQAIQMATLMVIGNLALNNQIPGQQMQNNTPPTPAATNRTIPASAPNRTGSAPAKKAQLTESQRRAFTRLGYKEGQEQDFLSYLSADEVTF